MITLSKSTWSVTSLPTLRSNADSRFSIMVERKAVLTIFNFENQRSVVAVVTGSVRHSLYRQVTLGYANVSCL